MNYKRCKFLSYMKKSRHRITFVIVVITLIITVHITYIHLPTPLLFLHSFLFYLTILL